MRKDVIVQMVDENNEQLKSAHILLLSVWERFFSFAGEENRQKACADVEANMEYISTMLNVVDDIIFKLYLDANAALDIKTPEVDTFVKTTRELYGPFFKDN